MLRAILNDVCYLLLYTRIGRVVLDFLLDIAWMVGYIKGLFTRLMIRIKK